MTDEGQMERGLRGGEGRGGRLVEGEESLKSDQAKKEATGEEEAEETDESGLLLQTESLF